jgi:hypothetical protein
MTLGLAGHGTVVSRHEGRKGRGGADEAQQRQRDDELLWRVRWMPDPSYPLHPYALVAYPWYRRQEADGIDSDGQLLALPDLWVCPVCRASWQRGLLCPCCMTSLEDDDE